LLRTSRSVRGRPCCTGASASDMLLAGLGVSSYAVRCWKHTPWSATNSAASSGYLSHQCQSMHLSVCPGSLALAPQIRHTCTGAVARSELSFLPIALVRRATLRL
jgi:hypothetical protein